MSKPPRIADLSPSALRAKLDRILDERVAMYRRAVGKAQMTLDDAAAAQDEIEAIRRQYRWVADNGWWLGPLARERKAEIDARIGLTLPETAMLPVLLVQPARTVSDDDRAEIEARADVQAVREAFPEATVSASRPLPATTPAPDEGQEEAA